MRGAVACLVLAAACTVPQAAPQGVARPSGGAGASPAAGVSAVVAVEPDQRPALVDVAGDVGLDFTHGAFRWGVSADPVAMMGGGACWLDADGDGWMDLYLVNTWAEAEHPRWVAEGGLPASTLFANDGGTFRDVGAVTGSRLEVRGQGCVAADLDGDGATDLYVTTARSSVLLWNDGDGTFTPDGGAAGLDVYGWHTTAAAGDVDGDGRLDLFVGGYVDVNARLVGSTQGFPRTHAPVRDLLLRNLGPADGVRARFVEVGAGSGLDVDGPRYTLGASFTDADGDADLDLLVADDTDPNRLYRNDSADGRIVLADVAPLAGADDDNSGMGMASGDVDADGTLDLLVTNMGEQRHTLLANHSTPQRMAYRDARAALGVGGLGEGLTGWGVALADLDRDADDDLVVANGAIPVTDLAADAQPLLLYEFDDGRFVEVSDAWGLDRVGGVVGRGMATADYDNDGDLDIAVVGLGGPAVLLESRGTHGGWLLVDPEDREPGTRVVADLPSGRQLVRELRAGSSYLSSEDPRVLLGLGDATVVPRVEVTWPDGTVAVLTDVAARQALRVGRDGRTTPLSTAAPAGVPAEDAGAPTSATVPEASRCDAEEGGGSEAHRWIEAVLRAIRRDLPAPTVHARNLYHVSAAMWDAWAAFDLDVDGLLVDLDAPVPGDPDARDAARRAAVAQAAHDVAVARYADAHGGPASVADLDEVLRPCRPGDDGVAIGQAQARGAAVGADVAAGVLAATADDGAAQGGDGPAPVNPPLEVAAPGTAMVDPDRWQPLRLEAMVSQNGIPVEGTVQTGLGPRWGWVEPFALPPTADGLPLDPGPPPRTDDADGGAALRAQVVEVIAASSRLDPRDGEVIDISPAAMGGNALGADDGTGYPANPVTGAPYPPNLVARGDFERVLAEFWADGPTSETPPGHWNTLAGEVSAALAPGDLRIGAAGPPVDRLEWDVKLYLALNGALHDAAIAAWGAKAAYDSSRPISLVRHMGGLGQSSDPSSPAHHPDGLPLIDGLITVVTASSSAPGGPHQGLDVGRVVVRTWTPRVGGAGDPSARVRWIPAEEWVPYQRPTFVTPAFPGYVSGHSTFSRAAAEVLTAFTGTPWFPGGLATWTVPAGGLVFEDGPTTDVVLQWASYADAADQAGRSRIHGGIHITADDHAGRRLGAEVGRLAWARAQQLFGGEP